MENCLLDIAPDSEETFSLLDTPAKIVIALIIASVLAACIFFIAKIGKKR